MKKKIIELILDYGDECEKFGAQHPQKYRPMLKAQKVLISAVKKELKKRKK